MESIEPTIALLQTSSVRNGLDLLREAEFLRSENDGRATTEAALLLAEAESRLLQTPHPDREVLQALEKLRLQASRDI